MQSRLAMLRHHMARLREAGLARSKRMAAEIQQAPQRAARDDDWITALGWPEFDQQVLRNRTHNGRLRAKTNGADARRHLPRFR